MIKALQSPKLIPNKTIEPITKPIMPESVIIKGMAKGNMQNETIPHHLQKVEKRLPKVIFTSFPHFVSFSSCKG